MLNITDFRDLIIKPTLDELAKAEPRIRSDAAVALLLGTALCESELTFLRQRAKGGFGPALSFFQIEPATHNDVKRYLNERRPDLAKRVFGLSPILDPDGFDLFRRSEPVLDDGARPGPSHLDLCIGRAFARLDMLRRNDHIDVVPELDSIVPDRR